MPNLESIVAATELADAIIPLVSAPGVPPRARLMVGPGGRNSPFGPDIDLSTPNLAVLLRYALAPRAADPSARVLTIDEVYAA